MTSLTFYSGVDEIGGKTLYPVHTEHPEDYRSVSKDMILVEEGRTYDIS